jgi:Lipopolysaccharide-assembly
LEEGMNGPRRTNIALRYLLPLACAGLALALPACTPDNHFTVLGYTTAPNYDCNIHTVRVPIFDNRTWRRGLEFDLTQAVVRDIQLYTPYRVVGFDQPADTELQGRIVMGTKGILNVNQQGEIREAETAITVEVSWVDLRTGQLLSKPGRRYGEARIDPLVPPTLSGGVPGALQPAIITPPLAPIGPNVLADGSALPPSPPNPDAPRPDVIRLRTVGSYVPELNGSTTTGFQQAVDKMAVQIVSMMEKPW